MTPLRTQPYFPNSPLTDAFVAPDENPPPPRIEAVNNTRISSASDLTEVRFKGANNMIYWIYQYWVHQNPGNHLDGVIKEYGKWQASWEKLICLTTQCYNTLYGQGGISFAAILAVELDSIQAWKWNTDPVIIFQLFILQCVQLITGAKNICARNEFRLDYWNYSAFGKLVNGMYTATMGYLGRARGIQSKDQNHCMFSNLVLH